jgi:hypothetical protein
MKHSAFFCLLLSAVCIQPASIANAQTTKLQGPPPVVDQLT